MLTRRERLSMSRCQGPTVPPKRRPARTGLARQAGGLALKLSLVLVGFAALAWTARAQAGAIHGNIVYYGAIPDNQTVWVSAFTTTQNPLPPPVVSVPVPGPRGPYALAGLNDGTYYVFAYLDVDGSGGAPGPGEPFNWHDPDIDNRPDPVVVSGGQPVGGVDVALSDPWAPLDRLTGQVTAIAVHPTVSGTVYAGLGRPNGGGGTAVYRSVDGGATWAAVYTTTVNRLSALGAAGSTVYAAGESAAGRELIVRSTDGGDSWTEVLTGTGQVLGGLKSLAVDPTLTSTVYAAGVTLGPPNYQGTAVVYRSTDSGTSWQRALTVTAECCWADFLSLAVDPVSPANVLVGGYESDAGAAHAVVYRSTDGGDSWTRVLTATDGPSQQFTALLVHPLTPTTLFAGSQAPKYLYRSTDGGLAWTPVLSDSGFQLAWVQPATLYSFDDWREVYRSTAGGDPGTWVRVGGDTPGDIRAAAVEPTAGRLYLGFRVEGLYASADGAQSWGAANAGLYSPLRLAAITIDPSDPGKLLVAAGCDGGWTSADGGENWSQPLAGCVGAFAVNRTDPSQVHGGRDSDRAASIVRSTDGGVTFTPAYTAPYILPDGSGGSHRVETLAGARSSNVVLAGGEARPAGADPYGVILRSSDGGLTWAEDWTQPLAAVYAVAIDPRATFYAAGQDCAAGPCTGFVRQSADGGDSWSLLLTTTAAIRSLVVDEQKPAVLYAAADDYLVFKSTDAGASWSRIRDSGDPSGSLVTIDPRVPSYLYLGGASYIAVTGDGGETWSDWGAPFNQGTAGMVPLALTADQDSPTQTVYAGFSGLWHYVRPAPQPGRPASITVAGDPPVASVGMTVTVAALVVDGRANWVVDGTVVTLTSSPEGTFGSPVITRTVQDGRATAVLTGVISGTATITATAEGVQGVGHVVFEFRLSRFSREIVQAGLSLPTMIAWAPDGRMFIAHQDGRVLVRQPNGDLSEFIDISAQVNNNWNRGLIGIAVHPSYPNPAHVYLSFTYDPPELPGYPRAVDGPDGWGSRVSRVIRVTAFPTDTNAADPASELVLLGTNSTLANLGDPADPGGSLGIPACDDNGTPIQDCLPSEGPSHSIGMVAFGHDGSLFVTNGEGAPYIVPDVRSTRALNLDSLGGKVLRIDPETGAGYPDNPYYDGDPLSDRSKVWSYGLRNPFRFALDPLTHTLYLGDVGWFSWEEIDTGRAANFGWPCYEGGVDGNLRHPLYQWFTPTMGYCGPLYDAEPNNGVTAPLHAFINPGPSEGGAAVVMGAVYSATAYPEEYRNMLFFADYGGDSIAYLDPRQAVSPTVHVFLQDISGEGGPVHLAVGPDGNLYYVSLNSDPNGPSTIYRIVYSQGPTAAAGAVPTYGPLPLTVAFSSEGTTDPNDDPSELLYTWSFGDGEISQERHPTHTYTVSGTYGVELVATNSRGASGRAGVVIYAGDTPPTCTIVAPAQGMTYTMGLTVTFSGFAADAEEGSLPAERLAWSARLYFNNHFHPAFWTAAGIDAGAFTIPPHNDDTVAVLCLSAADSAGLTGEACVEVSPYSVPYHFETVPAGLQLYYDSHAFTTPHTVSMIVNAQRTIAAPPEQAGLPFTGWSDGGAISHDIVGGTEPRIYRATYGWRVYLPLVGH